MFYSIENAVPAIEYLVYVYTHMYFILTSINYQIHTSCFQFPILVYTLSGNHEIVLVLGGFLFSRTLLVSAIWFMWLGNFRVSS